MYILSLMPFNTAVIGNEIRNCWKIGLCTDSEPVLTHSGLNSPFQDQLLDLWDGGHWDNNLLKDMASLFLLGGMSCSFPQLPHRGDKEHTVGSYT